MLEDSDRLLHTIDQVLRAGSAGSRLRRAAQARVNLAEITRESVALARHAFPAERRSAVLRRGRRRCRAGVVGDADELRAAVWNLLDNAVKYSPPTTCGLQVRLERDAGRGGSRCGSPITASASRRVELKRIFQRFYRVPTGVAVRAKGSGLGLFIVRSVARKHGGRAFAESEGSGPRQHLHPDPAAAGRRGMTRAACPDRRRRAASGRGAALQPRSRRLRRRRRRDRRGRARAAACDASRAPFDLVVLDVMLPGKDGFAVVSELRQARQFVPVLMLTARGRPEDVLKGFAAGADDYLPKPTELAILLARIGGLLRRSEWAAPAPPTATPSPARRSTSTRWSCGSGDRIAAADADGGQPAALPDCRRKARRFRGSRCSKTCGACTKTPTRGPSTTSSCGCGATSRRIPASPKHLLTVRGVGYRFVAETGVADWPHPAVLFLRRDERRAAPAAPAAAGRNGVSAACSCTAAPAHPVPGGCASARRHRDGRRESRAR